MPERFVTQRGPRDRTLLDRLIQAEGLPAGGYAPFFVTGEGAALPTSQPGDEIEERSGFVLDREGHVFFFWLGWDPHTKAVALTTWKLVEPESGWASAPEYQRARERLGLGPS